MATRNSETRIGTRKEISGEAEIIGTIMEAIKEVRGKIKLKSKREFIDLKKFQDMINGIKPNSTVEIMQMTRVSKTGWHSIK